MTTMMSLAQTDSEARIQVGAYRGQGFPNIAVIGPDTSIEVFGASQSARWIVIASHDQIRQRSAGIVELPEYVAEILDG